MRNNYLARFQTSDPEFYQFFEAFAEHEAVKEPEVMLDEKKRCLAILATLLGCQGIDLYKNVLREALEQDVSPVEVKETVYQAVAYLGIGRVYPFLKATNDVLTDMGISLPTAGQATTTPETRLEQGSQAQADIFGSDWKDFYKSGPVETRHMNRWLAANCFGDYYTRNGLDKKLREMITFCFLSAQGTEPQLKGHINGNFSVGNDKAFLIAVASQCMPYIGYPRTLNTLRCINEVVKENEENAGGAK